MLVSDFLTALESGIKVKMTETVVDGNTSVIKELITIVSVEGAGDQLSTELLARVIDEISIYGKTSICLHLSAGT